MIIQNEKDEVLLQQRQQGIFGLPGGLMDLGESFEETAIREVFEETNLTISNLELRHVFQEKNFIKK